MKPSRWQHVFDFGLSQKAIQPFKICLLFKWEITGKSLSSRVGWQVEEPFWRMINANHLDTVARSLDGHGYVLSSSQTSLGEVFT